MISSTLISIIAFVFTIIFIIFNDNIILDKTTKYVFDNHIFTYNLNKNGFSTMQVKRVTVDSVDYKFCSKWYIFWYTTSCTVNIII